MKIKIKFRIGLFTTSVLLFALGAKALDSQQDGLKLFLQDRPPIYRIVFQLMEFTNGNVATSSLYEGGWNKSDFYLKQYAFPGFTNTPSQINLVTNFQIFWAVGKYGSKYWHMTSSNDLTTSELQPQTLPESNPISAHALNLKLTLDRTLNLGIDLLKRGTMQWSNDSFTADYEDGIRRIKKITYNDGGKQKTIDHFQMYGQIFRENGQIAGIKIIDYSPIFGTSYMLDYKYDSNNPLPLKLPNTILRSRVFGPKSELVERIDILSIEFSDANSPSIAYTTDNYIASKNSYNLLFSNNQYYTFSSNHVPQLLNFVSYKGPSVAETRGIKFIIIGVMILTTVILFSFLHFQSKSGKQKNNKRSKAVAMIKSKTKITMLITIAAAIIGARVIYACNVTNGGPCHTATSNQHEITCAQSYWDGLPCLCFKTYEITETVTDTTGDGNRIISCGTADTGLDGTTTGQTTCSYDEDIYYCKIDHYLNCDPCYDGIGEKKDTVSNPATFCGASGNACPGE